MRNKLLLVFSVLVVAIMVLAACGGDPPTGGADAGPR